MFGRWVSGEADFELVPLVLADSAIISRIHGEAFLRQWSDGEFASLIAQSPVFGFLAIMPARPREQAAGFVLVREAAGEAEILSIGVLSRARRSSLGWRLMQAAMREAMTRGAGEMFLEVDETNLPAIALYDKLGFTKVGERRAYYEHEDASPTSALVLRRDISGRST